MIKQQIEQIIKKNLPNEKITQSNYSTSDIRMCSSTDIEMEKNRGFNQALSQIDTKLIADEVLKVVVETGEKLSQCISEIRKIDNQRMIEASKNNRVSDTSVTFWCQVMEKELLESILSPNKENDTK